MKVSFVGKGGSGKSTICSMYSLYLLSKKQNLLIIDADLNIHIPELINIDISPSLALSEEKNTLEIKKYLIGNNKRVRSPGHMYKTTPPANGSQFLEISDTSPILKKYSKRITDGGYFMFVGTYSKEEIGKSCYHTNLSILENLLSHSVLGKDDWIVTDMVAGIDAFANTLHTQFDVMFLVVEPTLESIEVFHQYAELGGYSDMFDRVYVIGNKVESPEDEQFLKDRIGSKYLGSISRNLNIKSARQKGTPLDTSMLTSNDHDLLENMMKVAQKNIIDDGTRLKKLYELHRRYSSQDYVKRAVGDISGQIDSDFKYE